MGQIKIENSSVNLVKQFGDLLIGETFRYGNNLYLKTGDGNAFDFYSMYSYGFNDLESVVPVNSKLIVED